MSMDVETVVYRRQLKRRLRLWQVVGVVAVAIAIAVAIGTTRVGPKIGDRIARLEVAGVIVDDPARDELLKELRMDDRVKALILRINSPGGTVVGGETLYGTLRKLALKKPVVAVMGELAASGGYMAALGADHIIARQGTITGSIGVILQTTEFTGLLEKLGIKPEAIKSRPLKAQPSPLEPMSEEGRQATKAVVLDMYQMFVEMVAERRNMPIDEVFRLADGRIYTGRQAKENGLIDELGGEHEALVWLSDKRGLDAQLPVRDVAVEDGFEEIRDLFGSISGKSLFSETLTLDGLLSLWHPGS